MNIVASGMRKTVERKNTATASRSVGVFMQKLGKTLRGEGWKRWRGGVGMGTLKRCVLYKECEGG